MTLIGVAGSTALLLTGYGIKDSINILTDLQYGNLYHYQVSVGTESDLAQEEFDAVQQQVQGYDGVEQAVPLYSKSMDFTKEGEERVQSATLSIFADDETLSSIITLRTRRGHDPIELQQQGAVITEKLAKQLDVEVGDTIVLRDGTQRIPFTVTGITEHYLMHYVYVSQSAYEQAAGTLPRTRAAAWPRSRRWLRACANRRSTCYCWMRETPFRTTFASALPRVRAIPWWRP